MAHEAPLLRTQLLKWLIGPLLLLLVADTFVSYRVALRFAERAYDVALIEIVREVALHVKRGASGIDFDMPEAARRVLFTDPSDSLYYEIVTPEGRLVAGQPVTPAPMRSRAAAGEALYDGGVNGSAVRVAELRIGSEDHPQSTIAYARVAETKN